MKKILIVMLLMVSRAAAEPAAGTPSFNRPFQKEVNGYTIQGVTSITVDNFNEQMTGQVVVEITVYRVSTKALEPAGTWTFTDNQLLNRHAVPTFPSNGDDTLLIFVKQNRSAAPIRTVPFDFTKYQSVLAPQIEVAGSWETLPNGINAEVPYEEKRIVFKEAFDSNGDKKPDLFLISVNENHLLLYRDDRGEWFNVTGPIEGC